MEIIIADGGSTDGTLGKISTYAEAHRDLRIQVIDNPIRIIPAALNRAIEASCGEIVIRLDAHSIPNSDYLQRCVDTLKETNAANVGGVWRIQPGDKGWIAEAIAKAASHPIGAGDARYRIGGDPGPVDTVPFGAFQRDWLDRVGSFNEDLLTNEDYEFNTRIRQAGGVIWFDPAIECIYLARPNLKELAKQYWRYGFWKLRMLLRYPGTLRWRQALPPLFVLATLFLAGVGFIYPTAHLLLGVQWGTYAVVLLGVGIWEALQNRRTSLVIGFPLAITTMHLAWGSGFIWSIVRKITGDKRGT
jgi:glycosyltransferase involved in cell wall biosynthesis